MECKDCVYEQRCFPLLHILNRYVSNTICQQGRQRNRQTTLSEVTDKPED
jgi:hypothetical protein